MTTRVWVRRAVVDPPTGKLKRNNSSDESPVKSKPLVRSKSGDEMLFQAPELYEWVLGWMEPEGDLVRINVERKEGTRQKSVLLPSDSPDILLAVPDDHSPPSDLVQLDHFHEPTVVECLQQRFQQGHVYTRTGPVLIALNPFEYRPKLYDCMDDYWNKVEQSTTEELPPHVYQIADAAFRSMMRGVAMAVNKKQASHNQSILVSGESGAGKTVTTKYLMQYLAALSQRCSKEGLEAQRAHNRVSKSVPKPPQDEAKPGSSVSSIESQVLQSNPILESFGNARTVRNDNSSRFGKFIQLQFTDTGRLVGTKIQTYLLETVRVVHPMPGERNYHIFYELLASSNEVREELMLKNKKPADFRILAMSGITDRRDGVEDSKTYMQLIKAMLMMEFSTEDRKNIFAIVAALMHASNLNFVPSDSGCSIEGDAIDCVCELLGVTREALNEALCFRTIIVRDKPIRSPLAEDKTLKGLDAFTKAVYHAVFKLIVKRVNDKIAFKKTEDNQAEPKSLIGILDIFGFESFQRNSFEQLCINYCNEVLQQQFNTFMLKNEQAEYVSEGLDWDMITFPENEDVLDLISAKGNGIVSILDDMCKAPGTTDKSFALEIAKRCVTQTCFEASYDKGSMEFTVTHFAGKVQYSIEDFIEKNRNDLPKETASLLEGSTKSFVSALVSFLEDSNQPGKGKITVGGMFLQQVSELSRKIESTKPHYVRCIKPNSKLVPGEYDRAMVSNQLRCGGILQAVGVTRDGFTLHYAHQEFVERYLLVLKMKCHLKESVEGGVAKAVDMLIELLKASVEEGEQDSVKEWLTIGKTKVLLKHQAFETLEGHLAGIQNEHATKMHSIFRRHLCRVAYLSVRDTFRNELAEKGETFESWFKENRELYYKPRDKSAVGIPNLVSMRLAQYKKAAASNGTKVRKTKAMVILNPAWIVDEGIWKRNPNYKKE